MALAILRELSRDLFYTVGKQSLAIFKVLRIYLSKFSTYFHKFCLVARSYNVLAVDKYLVLSDLVTLATRLEVLILPFFDDFFCIFRAVRLGTSL